MENSFDIITNYLPDRIRAPLIRALSTCQRATEIVLRTDRPLCVYEFHRLLFVTDKGLVTDSFSVDHLLTVSASEIESIVLKLCDHSVYAYQNEINSGFITIGGGVRVGICGKAVMTDGKLTNVRDISTLCFRIARDVHHCANQLLSLINPLDGALICGVPGSGKTTMIRDMARQLSYTYHVSVPDERCEITAYSRTKPSFDLGLCDIYAGYPKGLAANHAIRSMVPDIIVCDEIGDKSDADMLRYSLRCGVAFIATVHASSMQDLRNREITSELINTGAFRYIVFLKSNGELGKVDKIYELCEPHG